MLLDLPDKRIPRKHQIRQIKKITEVLKQIENVFDLIYYPVERPPIPPERFLEGTANDRPLFYPERSAVLRAIRVQPDVSLVPGQEPS